MPRFADVITLVSVSHEKNDEGVVTKQTEEAVTFCNRFRVGLDKRIAGKSAGLEGLVVVQLRSTEYQGQPYAVFEGVEYTVEGATDTGEFTTLDLAKRLPNG